MIEIAQRTLDLKAGEDAPPRPGLRAAALFAGIGGIELGLHRAGHTTQLFCEVDPTAAAVLRDRFPSSDLVSDVREVTSVPRDTEIVTAGFPCQDLSQAGTTRGIKGARSGLVGEVFRLLKHRRVPWLLIENVPFMLRLARGEAMAVVIAALDALEYRWAYRIVDSRAFGLPHRRRRVYLVASAEEDPRQVLYADDFGPAVEPGKDAWREAACGFYWTEGTRGLGWAHDAVPTLKGGSAVGIPSAPAIILPYGDPGSRIGMPDLRDAERLQGFDAGWTEAAESVGRPSLRWRLVGNAVTVDVAAWIGRRLRDPGEYDAKGDTPLARAQPWPTAAYNVGDGPKVALGVTEWPVRDRRTPLVDFLEHPLRPLSARATRGFYSRFSSSRLAKPEGFLEALQAHLKAMEQGA